MGADEKRDPPKSERALRSSSLRSDVVPSAPREPRVGESEPPTRPHSRTIADSEQPEPRASASMPSVRITLDSFHPVRVPVRSVRPPLPLWKRTWATAALVIVVAGGALGIVTGLRARTIASSARSDRARAAPGLATPPPPAPTSAGNRGFAAGAVPESAPIASSPDPTVMRAAPSAVVFRTTESMAVSPPVSPSAGVALFRRTKPKDITPPRTVTPLPPEESVHVPTPAPAPATSESPVNKDDSEAWVTEERRF